MPRPAHNHLDGRLSVMHDDYNMPDASPDLSSSDTPPKKHRFRLRYSLKSLLIFMLLVSACGCGEDVIEPKVDGSLENRASQDMRNSKQLVAALSSDDSRTRSDAAASLRKLLRATPGAKTNNHGRSYWEKRVEQFKPGMKHAEVVKLFPTFDRTLTEELLLRSGPSSGGSHIGRWRLDHYWVVNIHYTNPDKIIKRPTIVSRAMYFWVLPPKDFSGTWITWHVNGQKGHEINYRAGKYHGVFISFLDNGRISHKQHYVGGVASGLGKGWFRDGSRKYELKYTDGKRDGVWTYWNKTGGLRSRKHYRRGIQHGSCTSWFNTGQKRYETHYEGGKKHGSDKAWDRTGAISRDIEYVHGRLIAP